MENLEYHETNESYLREVLESAELFAHDHKGADVTKFSPADGNLWMDLSMEIDALVGCIEAETSDWLIKRSRSFLAGDWAKPETMTDALVEDENIENGLKALFNMTPEERKAYNEHLREVMEADQRADFEEYYGDDHED